MNKRETRVINAFINCVDSGEYSYEYAIILLEDNYKYGYLSEAAKDVFYEYFENKNNSTEEIVEEIIEE